MTDLKNEQDHLLNLDLECVKCSAVKVAFGPDRLKQLGATSPKEPAYFHGPLPRGKFDELIKYNCHLSQKQNDKLMKNLDIEKLLADVEKIPNSSVLKEVREMLHKALKSTRFSQRPLLVAISRVDEAIGKLKSLGKSQGLEFPDKVPSVKLMGPEVFRL